MAQSSQKSIDETQQFRKEFSGGYFIHPRGMGINIKQAQRMNQSTWRVFNFDLLSMKHPKEFRIRNTGSSIPGSYIFGKLNSAFFLRGGIGLKKNLSRKFYHNTISASVQVDAGPVAGLLKPVYLQILRIRPDQQAYQSTERYDPVRHSDQSAIIGTSPFSKGLGEIKSRMGGYVKGSLMLDWSDFPDYIQSIELGLSIDMFAKPLPIMAFAANKNMYSTMYICINLGNRW